MTSSEATNSVFNVTNKNNNFSISTPNHWSPEDSEELLNKLNKFLDVRSENDIELLGEEVEKRGTRIEKQNSGYNLAGFDHFESEIISEL